MLITLPNGAWIDSRAHVAVIPPSGNVAYVEVWHDQHHQKLGPFRDEAHAIGIADDIAKQVNDAREKERT